MKIITYTSITSKFDKKRNDILCFDGERLFHNSVLEARIYKVLSHKFLDCDISIWLDGNIYLKVEPEKLISEFLGDNDMAIFSHFARNCVYQEIEAIKSDIRFRKNKKLIAKLNQQGQYYKSIGYPEHFGLYESGMIIRRHNKKTEALNEAWWAEICRWQQRDQVSFPVIKWQQTTDLKLNIIPSNVREHEYFNYRPHRDIKRLFYRKIKYLLLFIGLFLIFFITGYLVHSFFKLNSYW